MNRADSSTPQTERPRALVSVHDLMPETLPAVRATLALLERRRIAPVTLLVVPGAGWDAAGIASLHALEGDGYRLAGHGWRHRCERFGGLYHRLHGALLSRRAAEHLALDGDGVIELMRRCHTWFGEHGLASPALYVPPAWALGAISVERLGRESPFSLIEAFDGVLDVRAGRRGLAAPLLGYEADAPLRAPVLRLWNRFNRRRARQAALPMRIGIHPRDLEYALAGDLRRDLERGLQPIDYTDLAA